MKEIVTDKSKHTDDGKKLTRMLVEHRGREIRQEADVSYQGWQAQEANLDHICCHLTYVLCKAKVTHGC